MFKSIAECRVPVIARINGAALGGGSGLTAAADVAVAVRSAVFGFTEASLGLLPATISPFVMRKIGNQATRFFLTAERFSADVARDIGLVHVVCDSLEEVDAQVMRMAKAICNNGPEAVANSKLLIREVAAEPRVENLREYTANAIASARVSPEGQDGLRAFLSKGKPSWRA